MCAEFWSEKISVGTRERRMKDNIKAHLQEIEHVGMYWSEETEPGLQWREIVKRALKLMIL